MKREFFNPYKENFSVAAKKYVREGVKSYHDVIMDSDVLMTAPMYVSCIDEYKIFIMIYSDCMKLGSEIENYIYLHIGDIAVMLGKSRRQIKKMISNLIKKNLIHSEQVERKLFKLAINFKMKEWKM